jgi:hypothetical protein
VGDPTQAISIRAEGATHWRQGAYEVWVLHGNVQIVQGTITARGGEAVLRLLSEGAREGAILPHAEQMARNVLKLRSIEVERCMAPWEGVLRLRLGVPSSELYSAVARSPYTRIPVVDERGVVRGYVHQLDVLGEGEGAEVLDHLEVRRDFVITAGLGGEQERQRIHGRGHGKGQVGTNQQQDHYQSA